MRAHTYRTACIQDTGLEHRLWRDELNIRLFALRLRQQLRVSLIMVGAGTRRLIGQVGTASKFARSFSKLSQARITGVHEMTHPGWWLPKSDSWAISFQIGRLLVILDLFSLPPATSLDLTAPVRLPSRRPPDSPTYIWLSPIAPFARIREQSRASPRAPVLCRAAAPPAGDRPATIWRSDPADLIALSPLVQPQLALAWKRQNGSTLQGEETPAAPAALARGASQGWVENGRFPPLRMQGQH